MKPLLPLLLAASAVAAVPERYLDAVAWSESRNNPRAVGSSGDRGLFQFTPIAWEQASRLRRASGLPVYSFAQAFDPVAARAYARTYFDYLERDLHRRGYAPTPSRLWLAWTLGPAGGAAIGYRLDLAPAYKVRGFDRLASALR
jgi:soluble lytic murein transglycosylase-like protein